MLWEDQAPTGGKAMLREKVESVFERLADTTLGSVVLQFASDTAFGFARVVRRPTEARARFDQIFQRPIASAVQWLKNLFRKNLPLGIAEELPLPNEDQIT